MALRFLACALAFAVIGGPMAVEICEAICADHSGHSFAYHTAPRDRHSADHRSHASHHHPPLDSAAPTTTDAMGRVPHVCGPSDAIVVTASRDVASAPIAKALVTTARVIPVLVER